MTVDESANNDPSTPKDTRRAGRRRAVWIAFAVVLVVASLLGTAWLVRGCVAKADGCSCEDRLQFIHKNDFHDSFPPAPDLSHEEGAERERQLIGRLDAFLLGKWEVVDQVVVTTQASIAPVAHLWQSQVRQPCWAYYGDHATLPAGSGDFRVARSTCGRHDLFAFAFIEHTGNIEKDRYNTWGFFRLRLKGGAS